MNQKKSHSWDAHDRSWISESVTVNEKRLPGTPPKGWKKTQFYVPEAMLSDLDAARRSLPSGSMKLIGTAAVGLFVGLPPEVRAAAYEWAHRNELRPERADPRELIGLVLLSIKSLMDAQRGDIVPLSASEQKSVTRVMELVGEPVQHDGFVERVVRTFVVREDDVPDQSRERKAGGA